jgi:hypothetical protein
VAALLLAGFGAAACWWHWRGGAAPASGPASPFLNTQPGVKRVGDDRCAECHASQAASYRAHPMGRSVSLPTHLLAGQREAASTFTAAGLLHAVDLGTGQVVHREAARGSGGNVVAEQAEAITYAVGSGRQGQSFVLYREGAAFLSPVSWYSARRAWGLSPGFESVHQHFSRIVAEECLFCHADGPRADEGTENRYASLRLGPIGCERCHGPGELHVAARAEGSAPGGPDWTIVNPRHLEPALREAVCQQCHLQGELRVSRRGKSLHDYRPGLPLADFVAVIVSGQSPGSLKAVGQVEQIAQSRCFSGGKLGCISCHDPHVLPDERQRVAHYRGRCLACHADHGCSLEEARRRRKSPQDSCIDCHMPRLAASNIAHAAITDHRVPRRPGAEGAALAAGGPLRDLLGVAGGRELALALAEVAGWQQAAGARRQLAAEARRRLDLLVRADPDDARAWEGLGVARWREGFPRAGLAALEEALRREPGQERALESAARLAQELKELRRSEELWRALLAVNPSRWHAHASLAQVQELQGRHAEAAAGCRRSLALNPFEQQTRLLLVNCLLRTGEEAAARSELRALQDIRPAERDRLQSWFDEEAARARHR